MCDLMLKLINGKKSLPVNIDFWGVLNTKKYTSRGMKMELCSALTDGVAHSVFIVTKRPVLILMYFTPARVKGVHHHQALSI